MIALEYLIQLNNKPAQVIRDNFNRDCSLLRRTTCINLATQERADCFVCHSAKNRSTFNVNAKEHGESFALLYWIADSKNQAAINLAVESLAENQTVAATWRAVLPVLHPQIAGLKIHGGDRVKKLSVPIRADIPSGQAVLRLSATTFAELHCQLSKLAKP